jgi:hypothetical protein
MAKKVEANPRPEGEAAGVRTEKAAPKSRDGAPSAQFYSLAKEYRLGLEAVKEAVIDGKLVTVAGSGDHVQFHDWTAIVVGEDRIQKCLDHKRFGTDFDIDDRDQTGYWRENGFLTEVEEVHTVRKRIEKKREAEKVVTGANDPDDRGIPTGRLGFDYPES